MAKSTDNGNTWTARTLGNTPFIYDPNSGNISGSVIGISDMNGDQIADTVESTDGRGSVIIDNNGTAHLFWGVMRFIDDTPGDGTWSFFPATNGLAYWNENMNDNSSVIIASALDIDGSGILLDNYDPNGGIDIALYYSSLTSQPNAAVDANGNLYLVYSSVVETLNQGSQFYRHVYGIKSSDGGCTWTYPIDLTSGDDFSECVFPSIAHNVGANFHFIYQRDGEPGLNLQGDEDAVGINDIIYVNEQSSRLDTVVAVCASYIAGSSALCSGDSVLLTASCGSSWTWSTGETTQNIYAKNFTTYFVTVTTSCGNSVVSKTISPATTPPVFTIFSSASQLCSGDTAWLSVNIPGAYNWSMGGTSQTIYVTSSGTYSVTVTNCSGSAVQSVTISAPSMPVVNISGQSTICIGGNVTLTASSQSGGNYLWSTGETIQSITVDSAGTYSVSVTNCVGSGSSSFTVNNASSPTAIINPAGPISICQGNNITLTASAGGISASYLWSNGNTNSSINVNQAGNYYVTAYNICGDSSVSATVAVTMNTPPATPGSISGNMNICSSGGGIYTISPVTGASNYTWSVPSGTSISSGQGTTSVMVNFGDSSGYISVTAGNLCGNSSAQSIFVNISSSVTASVTISPLNISICEGDTVTLTANPSGGGVSPSYQWKINGFNASTNSQVFVSNNLTNGDIINCVMVSSASCATGSPASSNNVIATVNSNVVADVSIVASPGTTICSGDTVIFSANTNISTPTYQWMLNGIVASSGIMYSNSSLSNGDIVACTVSSPGAQCYIGLPFTNSVTIAVVNTQQPIVTLNEAGDSCFFASSSVSGAVYQWYLNGAEITGASGQFYNTSISGFYTVAAILSGCAAESDPVLCSMVGIGSVSNSYLAIYPNPGNGIFIVESDFEEIFVKITNVLGEETDFNINREIYGTKNKTYIRIINAHYGIYFLQLTAGGKISAHKIVVH